MNFVNQLEDHLRDLGAEARKKHPGVKEASERATLKLRTLQNQYVSAVRKASNNGEKHPDTKLFRSSDLLHPFLLAANYPNASPKLLDTSFKAMKILMEADAIYPGDGMNMVRVWMIQAQVVVSYSTTKDSSSSSTNGGKLATISNAMTSASTALAGATSSSSNNKTISPTISSNESTTSQPDVDNSKSNSSNTTSSSWFGGYFSSSGATVSSNNDAKASSDPPALAIEPKVANVVTAKSAVSSSHGQAGSGHLHGKDLEKVALDILSSLLQLLEMRDLPVSHEQWVQSVTICCLLYLPLRQNVRQAAHSTLPQVLSLLVKDKDASALTMKTWDDLLMCALGLSSSTTNRTNGKVGAEKRNPLTGAFGHCRMTEKDTARPPTPALSLELMATLLSESPSVFTGMGQKTFGVIVQVLQTQSKINSNASPLEFLRALQFALIVLQTQGTEWPAECRELIGRLIQPVSLATESIRKQADFEDGFIYKVPNKQIPTTTASSSSSKIATIQGLPATVLWKAALSVEILNAFVNENANKVLWLHEEVVGHLLEATSDFCTIGASCEDHINLVVRACRGQGESTSLAYAAESLNSIDHWKKGKNNFDDYILGDALWMGLNAILRMIDQLEEDVLEQSFAPALSVLQHYLKRFPANGTVVQRTLEGYFSLAKVSLNVPLLRRALLASLCKLSLPHWGSNDPTCLLKDHNIAALICLLNVIHRFHDNIETEWSLVLQTFEELSGMAIASSDLSNSAYVGALSISAVYTRFSSFSACLSDESLLHFMSGLKDVTASEQSTFTPTSPMGDHAARKAEKLAEASGEKSTIGEKIMNIGTRAMTWNSDGNDRQEDIPVAERTKNAYYDDYRIELSNRLESSRHPIRREQVPFSVALMADLSMSNAYRHSRSGAKIFQVLCSFAAENASMRLFLMDIVAMMIMSHIAEEDSIPASSSGPTKVLYGDPRQNQYLAVEEEILDDRQVEVVSQIDLLSPLCQSITNAESGDVSLVGLESLFSIMESTGHKLRDDAWKLITESIAGVPSKKSASAEWTSSCQAGFRCLKLMVDDFIDDAATAARSSLLDCCASFGSSLHDVNTSLTAIGLLWTIADQDQGTESVERALAKLVQLSGDPRPEVRNCAVNTLFSCVVGRGSNFSEIQWESCICTTIFGVYDTVTGDTEVEITKKDISTKKKSRYEVSIHHSRDSSDKQWLATQALVLQGLNRLLRNFFGSLLSTTDIGAGSLRGEDDTPWFDKAWNRILGYAYDAATQAGGRDTLDLRIAGVELIVLCNQLACSEGIQAAITPARVGTNMEVVNGALRSVRSPERPGSGLDIRHSHSSVTEMWRENLFLDAFDVLDSFREHLVGSSTEFEPHSLLQAEATQVQVLSKIAAELGKLYDCCKNNEFVEGGSLLNEALIEDQISSDFPDPHEDDATVRRFVRVIIAVAWSSSSGPGSRFLSQAQRSCMDIFKAMALDGSMEAFTNLSSLSDYAFFAEREPDGKPNKEVDMLCHEASNVLVNCISESRASDECKVFVLARFLFVYLEASTASRKKWNSNNDARGMSYGNLVRIAKECLHSAKRLDENSPTSSAAVMELLNHLWRNICETLSNMFSTKSTGTKQNSIANPADLAALVNAASKNVPERYASNFNSVLTGGASRCLEIVKNVDMSPDTKEDILGLFGACYAGASTFVDMQELGKAVLQAAMNASSQTPPTSDVNVEATLKICHSLQQQDNIETSVIGIFSELSQLASVEDSAVRKAISDVLSNANIGETLQDARARCMQAEERASTAEERVAELEAQVEVLQMQNDALERQLGLL